VGFYKANIFMSFGADPAFSDEIQGKSKALHLRRLSLPF